MKAIPIVQMLIGMAITGSAWAQNPLDDAIYSMKCIGADDKEACKAKARQAFEDYQKSKQSGQSGQVAGTSITPQSRYPNDVCKRIQTTGPASVDAAYVRAVKIFHFKTQEELDVKMRSYRQSTIVNTNFKHIRTPGVLYDLWDFVDVPGFSSIRPGTGLRLSKSETGGTDMDVEYCIVGDNPLASNQAFWDAADREFRGLVKASR